MPEFSTLRYDAAGGIATITFTRPQKRNSFSQRMCLELAAAFDESDADDAVRAVVVTGEGEVFCAGADLDEGFDTSDPSPATQEYLDRIGTVDGVPRDGGGYVALRMARSTKPVIVAFNGSAVGVGVTMTLPADIRVAGRSARFGLVFARRGLPTEAASSWFLPRIVGVPKAMEWIATGRLFGADEAHQAGLLNHVVDDAAVLETALDIAREIVANTAPVAVATSRALLWTMSGASSPWYAHAIDTEAVWTLAGGPDVAEGVASFLEKRPAQYPGRVPADLPKRTPRWPEVPDDVDVR
ncbi:enoyl-CoA hydratase/carnithine racemase [Mumia flava]|uniref:Enoyl-CoA hydratase/carnithine racemase n=1 Tax=Mumia flava TaxID=1348852 RepID=A0A0B2B7W7_9ACTN|nr:enoyl-CoA hydratase-related protein [Mumia flava]PJJ57915.1 enoyl-CoA hydratase/carnithine racemase [Mumia flava]